MDGKKREAAFDVPANVILVLQGGGALGAYQVGVVEALHEVGIDPAWVIGTSIGAINAAILAGNPVSHRFDKLQTFWERTAKLGAVGDSWFAQLAQGANNLHTIAFGVPNFFAPNPYAVFGARLRVGVEQAAYYQTGPLRQLLSELIDFDYLATKATRLTVGAVNARTGQMRYFDSRDTRLCVDHVLASGALPPAFPAVRIDGEPYWDGGIYSNTPMEIVFDDNPRRDAVIFTVNLWNPVGPEPESLEDVQTRQKDIQYASRSDSHVMRHMQTHRLRHVITQLAHLLPSDVRASAAGKALTAWGCATTMHVVRLMAPRLPGEDHAKDIDFSRAGIAARRSAGYLDTRRALDQQPWRNAGDILDGVIVHDFEHRDAVAAAN